MVKQSGEYASLAAGWVSDISQAALSGTGVPLTWSREANAYDCVSSPRPLNLESLGHFGHHVDV